MTDLVKALAPAFVIALGLEIFDKALKAAYKSIWNESENNSDDSNFIIILIVIVISFIIVIIEPEIRILKHLLLDIKYSWLDIFVTALIISAGTEGFNAIIKFTKNADGKSKEVTKLLKAANIIISNNEASSTINVQNSQENNKSKLSKRSMSVNINI